MIEWLAWVGLFIVLVGFIFGFGLIFIGYTRYITLFKPLIICGYILLAIGVIGLVILGLGVGLNSTPQQILPGEKLWYQTNQIVSTSTNADVVVVVIGGVSASVSVNNTLTNVNSCAVLTDTSNLKYLLSVVNNSGVTLSISVGSGGDSPLTWVGPFENIPT